MCVAVRVVVCSKLRCSVWQRCCIVAASAKSVCGNERVCRCVRQCGLQSVAMHVSGAAGWLCAAAA